MSQQLSSFTTGPQKAAQVPCEFHSRELSLAADNKLNRGPGLSAAPTQDHQRLTVGWAPQVCGIHGDDPGGPAEGPATHPRAGSTQKLSPRGQVGTGGGGG